MKTINQSSHFQFICLGVALILVSLVSTPEIAKADAHNTPTAFKAIYDKCKGFYDNAAAAVNDGGHSAKSEIGKFRDDGTKKTQGQRDGLVRSGNKRRECMAKAAQQYEDAMQEASGGSLPVGFTPLVIPPVLM